MKRDGLHSLTLSDIQIDDVYWNRYTNLIADVVIPYQWEILNDRVPDAAPSYCLQNFRIAAGESQGTRKGTVFLDSDAAKWLEAVAYSLMMRPDPKLEQTADEVIALIGRAQCEDGYLNTYYTLVEPEGRWSNLTEGHELYCAGHFIEAAVAYYEATGKKALMDILCRFSDLICSVFGPGEKQIHGYPGHPEVELALVKLYHATGKQAYLDTAKYFIDTRGGSPNYFLEEMKQPGYHLLFPEFKTYEPIYSQSHIPVRSQETAEGHAVRAVYLYSAMADIARLYHDDQLLGQCKILWNNMVSKRMYITGSIGSSGFWERFTTDYDLPNDTNYSETCASIGLAQFGLRMSRITRDASYIDTVERALYNNIRGGISMKGNRYFYVNPLEVWPDSCMGNTSRGHVKPVRQKWFDVACCPTNIARTFTSLGQYMYSAGEDELYVNLFVQNKAKVHLGKEEVNLSLRTDYPRSGNIILDIEAENIPFSLFVRVPSFAKDFQISINGSPAAGEIQNGYMKIRRSWNKDKVEISFTIKPQIAHANPLVRANCGKIAVLRGPEVYCFEETDNGNDLAALFLNPSSELKEEWKGDLLGGTILIRCKGKKLVSPGLAESFSFDNPPAARDMELTALPYGSWGNRTPGEMLVWVHALIT